jgi:hypothetical protein
VKRKITKYLFAIWFSILLLLGNTPMDFIHLFADHKDTIHHEHKGLVIENKHHHCACLSLTLTSFVNDYSIPVIHFISSEYFTKYTAISGGYIQRCIVAVSLRGPPVV